MLKYVANIDGGSRGNPGVAGFGIVVRRNGALVIETGGRIQRATCNEAEYAGLIALLKLAVEHQWYPLLIRSDSKLLVEQSRGRWKVKARHLKALYRDVQILLSQGGPVTFEWVPRERNRRADALANSAMDQRQSCDMRDVLENDVTWALA